MGGVVYRRLAVTIVADLNVIVAKITVMSSASHPSHRVSDSDHCSVTRIRVAAPLPRQ